MTCTDQERRYRLAVAVLSVMDIPTNDVHVKCAMLAIKREEDAIANNKCMCDHRSETSKDVWNINED